MKNDTIVRYLDQARSAAQLALKNGGLDLVEAPCTHCKRPFRSSQLDFKAKVELTAVVAKLTKWIAIYRGENPNNPQNEGTDEPGTDSDE